jgi:lipopolysaccharide transport system ATP-binding protein
MYVRLAFSVAAHLEPEILIVDEVLSVGDAEFQKKCLGKMGEVSSKEGRTVLFVSHQLGMVSRLCSQAILLGGGFLIAHGISKIIVDEYITSSASTHRTKKSDHLLQSRQAAILDVWLEDKHRKFTDQIAWHDPIRILVKIALARGPGTALLGIGIDSRHGARVTTFVSPLSKLISRRSGSETIALEITPQIIAPGIYTLTVALFEPGIVHHQLEHECSFVIVDSGSPMAAFDNVDYGIAIIPATWSLEQM